MPSLLRLSRAFNDVPLGWAGATHTQNYLNLGDALSPVMVAALSGKKITRLPMRAENCRMASTGSILHGFVGGEVHVWGSGISPSHNPMTKQDSGWVLPDNTNIIVHALRGHHTLKVLEKGGMSFDICPAFGDPVILLRRLYDPPVSGDDNKYELGIILHLSEVDGRELTAGPKFFVRYQLPRHLQDSVCFINTLTPVSTNGLRDKINLICSCKRIISTSFHGLLLAEIYDIPCLYIGKYGDGLFSAECTLDNPSKIDTRVLDFFMSLGVSSRYCYGSDPETPTDWDSLLNIIDLCWEPIGLDDQDLINSFPGDLAPIQCLSAPNPFFFDADIFSRISYKSNPAEVAALAKHRLKKELGKL